jgi:hypothetical protein
MDGRPGEPDAIGLHSDRRFRHGIRHGSDSWPQVASRAFCGARVAKLSQALCVREPAAPIGDKKCLEVAMPPLPFSGRSNGLAATQLRLTNSEEHQLHRRAQAREFGTGKLSKLYGPGIVVTQDALPCCIRFRGRDRLSLVKKKKNPRGEPGVKVTAMNTCHRNATPSASRLHHLTTRQRVSAVLWPIDLTAVPHRVCVIRTLLYLMSSKMRSGFEESRWFSGLDKWLFSGRRGTVRSLDISIQGTATTPCNAHAW